MSKSIRSLDIINPGESGLSGFDRDDFEQQLQAELQDQENIKAALPPLYLKLLGLFLLEKYQNLDEMLMEDPSLVASYEIKALKILNTLILGKEIKESDVFPLSSQDPVIKDRVINKVSQHLVSLYGDISKYIAGLTDLVKLDLWGLAKILPEINFYYSSYILENGLADKYAEVKSHMQEIKLESRKSYIKSWYSRTCDDDKSEQTLMEYREVYQPNEEAIPHIKSLANQKFYSADAVYDHWAEVLDEVDAVQQEVIRNAGLYEHTCEYFQCSDCCSNTFPTMTLTEYRYLKEWMKDNDYPIAEIEVKSQDIQDEYKKLHGESLTIVDKNLLENQVRGIENPHNFKYTCPFLIDGKCSVYKARPLLCRGFGLSTDNNLSLKTCKYYLAQYVHNSSPARERYAYDLSNAEMLAASSDRYITNKEEGQPKLLKGTIVAWFSS